MLKILEFHLANGSFLYFQYIYYDFMIETILFKHYIYIANSLNYNINTHGVHINKSTLLVIGYEKSSVAI